MGKMIHSISIADGNGGTVTETRTSATRAYGACVVRTVTARSVEIAEATRAAERVERAEQVSLLAARVARLGMDEAAAKAFVEAAAARWYSDEGRRVRDAARANQAAERAEMERRGFVYPYDLEGPFGIVDAAHNVARLTHRIEIPIPTVGAQYVESWHRDASLAAKAAAGYQGATHAKGDSFEVRTDITVRETGRRSK